MLGTRLRSKRGQMPLNSGTSLNIGKEDREKKSRKAGNIASSREICFSGRRGGASQGGNSSITHKVTTTYISERYTHGASQWQGSLAHTHAV